MVLSSSATTSFLHHLALAAKEAALERSSGDIEAALALPPRDDTRLRSMVDSRSDFT